LKGLIRIDEETKKETLQAMREGQTYEEVNRVYDDYRVKTGGDNE